MWKKCLTFCRNYVLFLLFRIFALIVGLAALWTRPSLRLTFSKETLSRQLVQMLSLNTFLGYILLRYCCCCLIVHLLMVISFKFQISHHLPFLSRGCIIRHFVGVVAGWIRVLSFSVLLLLLLFLRLWFKAPVCLNLSGFDFANFETQKFWVLEGSVIGELFLKDDLFCLKHLYTLFYFLPNNFFHALRVLVID